jgi:hypothetical protein
MATVTYEKEITALLVVGPDNELSSYSLRAKFLFVRPPPHLD